MKKALSLAAAVLSVAGLLGGCASTAEHTGPDKVIYHVNDCLGLGSRLEWYKSTIYTGSSNSTYSWTSGLNFRRNANITWRPELRVDWGEGAVDPGQTILASDLIVTF